MSFSFSASSAFSSFSRVSNSLCSLKDGFLLAVITGEEGSLIAFDGATSYITTPDSASLDLGTTGTIEAWVKLSSLNRWQSVIAKGNANRNELHNYALEISDANRYV